MSSLTKQQQRTLMYLAGIVLSLGLAGGLLYLLNSSRTDVQRLKQEVERKEAQAREAVPPSPEDEAKWAEQTKLLGEILLSDQTVTQFFGEITGLANENSLQRFGMDTNETVIDPNNISTPLQTRVVSVGVRRYLIISIKFSGEYPNVAQFIGGVSQLNRPVEFQSIELKRNPGSAFVDVVMILNVYKRESA